MSETLNTFDPVDYSIEENKFLLEHLGEPPVVALKSIRAERLVSPHPKDASPFYYPDGVNPKAVKPIIDRVYELEELEKHEGVPEGGQPWVGVERLKQAIRVYIEKSEKWKADTKRGGPRFPSLYTYDARGGRHLNGPGSDSGKVKTYFDEAGKRVPFAVSLFAVEESDWSPEWSQADLPSIKSALKHDEAMHRFECGVVGADGQPCGHTESYNTNSRASMAAARGRMSKHFRTATFEVTQHREAHTMEFGAPSK